MKSGIRILISIYISFIVYSLVTLIWGTAGILQTSMLENYKSKLIENTTKLKKISTRLDMQYNSLRSSQNLIALKARDLGFFRKDEGEIIVKGYKKNNSNFLIGSYYQRFISKTTSVTYIRFLSVIIGMISFLVMTIFKGKQNVYRKRSTIAG